MASDHLRDNPIELLSRVWHRGSRKEAHLGYQYSEPLLDERAYRAEPQELWCEFLLWEGAGEG